MLFNSWKFLIFFPAITVIYFSLKNRFRRIWLLFTGFFFYMCWNPNYVLLLGFTTINTYLCGQMVEKAGKTAGIEAETEIRRQRQKFWMILCLGLNLGVLFFFKYIEFAIKNLAWLSGIFGFSVKVREWDILLPVGISFYTFQALGYLIDVYRGTQKAERNLLDYALFVTFFPTVSSGPIERAGRLLKQLKADTSFSFDRFRDGLLFMLWGYFEKMVIADRIAILVNRVYSDYSSFGGFQILFATTLYAFQIYCDFAGYSDIACGAAKILGIDLVQNFRQPYFSRSLGEFWRRWHISLSSWFRDYLYIPLGGNRKGCWRKYRNLMIVFLVSGLWHGSSWNYVIWGCIHGAGQMAGDFLKPWRQYLLEKHKVKTECFSWKLLQTAVTFIFVDFAWLFFRAPGARTAFSMIWHSLQHLNPFVLFHGGFFSMGLDKKNMCLLFVAMSILILVDYLRCHGGARVWLLNQNRWFYYLLVYTGMLSILVFGVYGSGYQPGQFLYFQY